MNAIIVLVIGEKAARNYEVVRPHFEKYANKCEADLIVYNSFPDKSGKGRSLPFQKMLLASEYREKYNWILVLDIDILINKDAPSIFDEINPEMGFAANIVPSNSKWYNAVSLYQHKRPDLVNRARNILVYDNWDLLKKENFPIDYTDIINGGVILMNPDKIADMFDDYYYNYNLTYQGRKLKITKDGTEEEPMTYLTKCNNIFQDIDKKWNYQIMLPLLGEFNKEDIAWTSINRQNKIYNSIEYKNFVLGEMSKCYFLHFAGACRMPLVDYSDNRILEYI